MTNFGEVGKVYCRVEREAEEAGAVAVSLVVIPLVYEKGKYPLCENSLLWRVEDFMKGHTHENRKRLRMVLQRLWTLQSYLRQILPTDQNLISTVVPQNREVL